MIKAILFDMDGVIIETEQETFKFYQECLRKQGIKLKNSDFKYKAGKKSKDFWNDVLTPEQQKQIDTKKLTQLKRKMFNDHPEKFVKKIDGVTNLLRTLKNNKFKLALVSQNESQMINTIVDWLNIREYFDVLLSIDDTQNLKPDPEIYLLAAKKLLIDPNECVVVEDSQDCIDPIRNAQMKCIFIEHNYLLSDTIDNENAKINVVTEITYSLIRSI